MTLTEFEIKRLKYFLKAASKMEYVQLGPIDIPIVNKILNAERPSQTEEMLEALHNARFFIKNAIKDFDQIEEPIWFESLKSVIAKAEGINGKS